MTLLKYRVFKYKKKYIIFSHIDWYGISFFDKAGNYRTWFGKEKKEEYCLFATKQEALEISKRMRNIWMM